MEARARTYGSSGAYTKYSSYLNDEPMPDATSEKDQGNEYFKQKRFAQAIECYSRSIGLSPTANYTRSWIKYSLLKLHQQIKLKHSGNCEPNIFREEGRITCSLQVNDVDAQADH
uniref:Uncharacterized protein n=1 Tax=Leersia perrieri TaxID=77586 RepID=A0A0D9WCC8_9ORYZ